MPKVYFILLFACCREFYNGMARGKIGECGLCFKIREEKKNKKEFKTDEKNKELCLRC